MKMVSKYLFKVRLNDLVLDLEERLKFENSGYISEIEKLNEKIKMGKVSVCNLREN